MIYLDNAATTSCSEAVVEAMLPFFRENFANAASIDHKPGNDAKLAVEEARASIAALVGANSEDVIFTSGATEANNLAMTIPYRVLTTPIEHPSILDAFKRRQFTADAFLVIDSSGRVDQNYLTRQLTGETPTLVSVIATNNETGIEQDILEVARRVNEAGSVLHLDATQTIGTMRLNFAKIRGLAGLSLSAHKIHGPKGVGALVASTTFRRQLLAVQRGGGHERGLRSGTLNVPGIVGFGTAAKLLALTRDERRIQLRTLRATFEAAMIEALGDQFIKTVNDEIVSPHILSGRFRGINGRALLRAMRDDVAFSLGAACATNKSEPSHVLTALGLDKRAIAETVRFSFSHEQSTKTVQKAALLLVEAVRSLSDFSLTA